MPVSKISFIRLFLARFFSTYFFLLIVPFPAYYLPFINNINNGYYRVLNAITSWTGHHIFHISAPLFSTHNGSGDTTFDYVQLFILVLLSFAITIVWSSINWKRKYNDRILNWLLIYIRFYFGLIMMRYGFDKVIKSQFPFPYYSLTETYGDSSPMRLMWSFMGYSTAYNLFTGLIEVMAGFLVMFKRTTTIGALIGVAILTNVVVLNFCYDVPVKLFAVNFLLMAVFIAIPDSKRVFYFFFLDRVISAASLPPSFNERKSHSLWLTLKLTLVTCILYSMIGSVWHKYSFYSDGSYKKIPLFGIYKTETFIKNGDTLLPLLTDTLQWKSLTVSYLKKATIRLMNDSATEYQMITDTKNKKIRLSDVRNSIYKATFSYTLSDSVHLFLMGKIKEDSVYIKMRKQDVNQYKLINRGFHWINESPYNQ